MSHLVYKKPLREIKVREQYITDRKNLKKAKQSGHISEKDYEDAKRSLIRETDEPTPLDSRRKSSTKSVATSSLDESITDGSSPPKSKLGSILDRGGIATRVYKPEARTEEQRQILKLERRATELEKELTRSLGHHDEVVGSFGLFAGNPEDSFYPPLSRVDSSVDPGPAKRPTTAETASRKTSRSKLNLSLLPKRWNSTTSRSSRSSTSSAESAIPRRLPTVIFPRDSTSTSASTYTSPTSPQTGFHFEPPNSIPEEPLNWADKWVFGVKPGGGGAASSARSVTSRRIVRRHSFSSPERSRPSTARSGSVSRLFSDGLETVPPPPPPPVRDMGQPLSHGYDGCCYSPPSLLLLDLFRALMDEFSSSPALFEAARDNKLALCSSQSSIMTTAKQEETEIHPGTLVTFASSSDELVDLNKLVRKRVWFLMALKFLYYGRTLFSPGHHLLQLGSLGGAAPEELRVLDLDGQLTADWSWQAAHEYPDASIYTLTTSTRIRSISPLTASYAPPRNQRRHAIKSLTDLSSLPPASFDVISSRNLAAFLPRSSWQTVFIECHRLLKHDGYLELTLLDPVFNDMGPLTKSWVLENILVDTHPRAFDIMPSKTVPELLRNAGFEKVERLWMWMPTTTIGDEHSTITSTAGRWLYDELYGQPGEEDEDEDAGAGAGGGEVDKPRVHRTTGIWDNEEVMSECLERNTAFRWLKCWAKRAE